MQILGSEEPDTGKCTTERVTSALSKCSENNKECVYGFFASKSKTYCLHPDHRKFLMSSG
jgi:hypothetical protein